MPLPRSIRSFVPFASGASFARGALALALVLAASVGLRGERADACGFDGFSIEELTTFDPKVLGDPTWDGLYFDPFNAGYGGACADCATKAMLADWRGYLKEAVTEADWQKVLFAATPAELAAIRNALGGSGAPPAGYERSSLWKIPAARDRLAAAVAFVSLARRVEPHAGLEGSDPAGNPKRAQPPAPALLADAIAGQKAAGKDAFLAQRYAFLALRVLFYRRDWAGAIAFFDRNAKALAGPSADLPWRARYYVAGALQRQGKRARANLELARVHAGSPALAGAAAQDFQPMEEADWRETLRLAASPREKAQLWRLVGVKQDGLVAIKEIVKLDPKSDLIALLVVRELARAENLVSNASAGGTPAPAELAAQRKAYATVEQLAVAQAGTPGADRPWLMELVAAHVAAKRGDVAATRARLARATAARSGDFRVAAQAKASLALALAVDWKINPQTEQELARSMLEIDPGFGRLASVRGEVRHMLAAAYAKAGKYVEAELLRPGTATEPATRRPGKPAWEDPAFIKAMIAQTGRTSTPFEKFLLGGSYERPALEHELALRYLVDGDFAAAAQTFKTTKAMSGKLGTDPFAVRIVDCHDCDHQRYANAPWTHASLAARLAELERTAKGTGEPAAEASLAIGVALYNITYYGNARTVLAETHHRTRDTRAAEKWLKRAFELTKNRELKAKAAYLAAKAELGQLITEAEAANKSLAALPIPKTWFPAVKKLSDTKYYREVIRECGHFAGWARRKP
jgi:hypothetical protein